jgi:hypothetical protein
VSLYFSTKYLWIEIAVVECCFPFSGGFEAVESQSRLSIVAIDQVKFVRRAFGRMDEEGMAVSHLVLGSSFWDGSTNEDRPVYTRILHLNTITPLTHEKHCSGQSFF